MNTRGVAERYPVILGGAALTRAYVEQDLAELYDGEVRYARDAFEGLRLMDAVMAAKRGEVPGVDGPEAVAAAEGSAERKARRERSKRIAAEREAGGADARCRRAPTSPPTTRCPTPPFWGTRVVKGIPLADYASCSTSGPLFLGQWGLRGSRGGEGPSYEELVETEGRPRLRDWLDRLPDRGNPAQAAVVYGYFPACHEGDDLIVLRREPARRARPASRSPGSGRDRRLCLADFFRPRGSGEIDVVGVPARHGGRSRSREVATSCSPRTPTATTWSCTACRCSSPRRSPSTGTRRSAPSWASARDGRRDPDDVEDCFKLAYRGARYSFGYGACPDLEDRAKIVELLEPGADRRDALRGVPAAPGAVHRRDRGAPPRGEVLQHLSQPNSSAFYAAHWAIVAAGLPVSSATLPFNRPSAGRDQQCPVLCCGRYLAAAGHENRHDFRRTWHP